MSELLASHNARLHAIDPNAGPAGPLAEPVVEAAHVAGGIRTHRYAESDDAALWGPLVRHVLHLRWSGERSPDPALSALLRRITSASSWRGDAGAALVWPSHDLVCAGSFARHGMTPLTVLGMRVLRKNAPSRLVRPAGTGHLDAITDMAVRLHNLEASLGVLPTRPNLSVRLLSELTAALQDPVHRVFVATEGDSVIGFVHAQVPHGAWIESQVTPAPAGYVSRMFVDPAKRGNGVATALAASVENELMEYGARVALLHYSLHNPGGAALWVKRGYRSVLTTWSLRPLGHFNA
ncbi:GNAT family N-acetyltransferase [Lentzea guizhouensis]|uniref:GNAT family N-acetyltransferase n=1 Tax=Lentzea guizhouensis TaxID=1586287 RepID=UPI0012B69CA6|nr:GNAT family N-acetyltransferase [Lentzea guizhouensis]